MTESASEAFKAESEGSTADAAKDSTAGAGQGRAIESLAIEKDELREEVIAMREMMNHMCAAVRDLKRMQHAESTASAESDFMLVEGGESTASDTAVAKQSVESTASTPLRGKRVHGVRVHAHQERA